MTFAECIPLLLKGKMVKRLLEDDIYLQFHITDNGTFMMSLTDGYYVFICGKDDLEATDWESVK